MGLDYSYLLIFKRQDLWKLLEGVGQLCSPSTKQTSVLFPDRTLKLPFEPFASTPAQLFFDDETNQLDFMTCLDFTPDDALVEYADQYGNQPQQRSDGRLVVPIGYIYLAVATDLKDVGGQPGQALIGLTFTAATTNMSILFCESDSIRHAMVGLLEGYEGVCGILDREDSAELIWWRGKPVSVELPHAYLELAEIENLLPPRDRPEDEPASPGHYCLACGNEFLPISPEETLCPRCSGELSAPPERPEAPEKTIIEVEPPLAYCIVHGGPFTPSSPDELVCPDCQRAQDGALRPAQVSPDTKPPSDSIQEKGKEQFILEWLPGDEILDIFTVLALLGEGGMGRVYRVHHNVWNIDLAVKFPRAEMFRNQEQRDLVFAEAETWVNLGLHPHIVTCYYVRSVEGVPCLFAELVEGGTLADWIIQRKITTAKQAIDIAIQFAWGLDYAHQQGLVHCDIKPGNVMMTPDGIAKVTDFGLVKAVRGMTPAYASPEQADMAHRPVILSPKTDMWSWAVSILHLFAGKYFWVRPELPDYAWGQIAPQALEHYLSGELEDAAITQMPASLADLLEQCFEHDPAARPVSMDAVAAHLIEIYTAETGQPYPRQKPNPAELRADSLNNRALSLLDLGQPQEAARCWQQALQVDPHHLDTVYNYNLHRWRFGQQTDLNAVLALENAASSHPDYRKSETLLSQLRGERGETQNPDSDPGCRMIFDGHTNAVDALAVAPSGKVGLSGDWSGQLICWDALTAEQRWSVKAHHGEIYGLAVTPDNRLALSASGGPDKADTMIRVWDLATGQPLKTYSIHSQWVTSLAISPDGKVALSTSHDRSVRCWEVPSGTVIAVLRGHQGWVKCAAFSPSGFRAASVDWNGDLCLWDLKNGSLISSRHAHDGGAWKVIFTPDGKYLITAGADDMLRIWKPEADSPAFELQGHSDPVQGLAISSDGRWLLSGGWDRTVRLWSFDERRCLRTFEDPTDSVTAVAFLPGEMKAFSSGWDNQVRFWDLRGSLGQPAVWAVSLPVQAGEAQALSQKIEQSRLRARQAESQGNPQQAAREIKEARTISGFERDPGLLADWNRLGARFGRRIGLESCRLIKKFESERGKDGYYDVISDILPTPRGERLLTAGHNGRVCEWDAESGERLVSIQTECGKIYGLVRLSEEEAICAGVEGDLFFIDLQAGIISRRSPAHRLSVSDLAICPLGCHLATISNDKSVQLYDAGGNPLWRFETDLYLTAVQFSVDGQSIIVTSMGALIRLDLQGSQIYKQLEGNGAHCLSISLDNQLILGGGYGKELKLWELETGRLLQRMSGHTDLINVCGLAADAKTGISAGNDETLRFWDLASGECLRVVSGHQTWANALHLARDGTCLWSGDYNGRIYTWQVDWQYEFPEPADCNEGAEYYLRNFITLHQPLSPDGLNRRGRPAWTDEDFRQLLDTLGCAGYGWLRPEGVRRKLQEIAEEPR